MPWVIAKKGEEWCVYKEGADGKPTGDARGCHPTEAEAKKQQAALYVHAQDAPMWFTRAFVVTDAAEATADPASPVVFRASTEGVKRDGLDLKASDWLFEDFKRYPIILYGHDYSGRNLPIGLGEPIIKDNELHIAVKYDADDEFAMRIRAKALKGMIAGSVGWEDLKRDGKTKHNLMEFSMVPVPADPFSLPLRQAAALRSMADQLETAMSDSQAPDSGEGDWQDTARAMATCFVSSPDDPDTARLSRYTALLPKYRRLGKVPPEWMDGARLSALGREQIRGLFLENEPDEVPDAFPAAPSDSVADASGEGWRKIVGDLETRIGALEKVASGADRELLAGILKQLESIT